MHSSRVGVRARKVFLIPNALLAIVFVRRKAARLHLLGPIFELAVQRGDSRGRGRGEIVTLVFIARDVEQSIRFTGFVDQFPPARAHGGLRPETPVKFRVGRLRILPGEMRDEIDAVELRVSGQTGERAGGRGDVE